MKKIISLFLSIMLTIPLAGTAVAYWNDDWVPPGDWLGYSGEICVYFTHDYSCTLRDFTVDDFPKLKNEIESIKNITTFPFETVEEMQNRLDYRRRVYITLKDKSEESIRSAVYYLDSLSYVYESIASHDIIREGDVNCDRTINLNDASHMLKYIAGWNSYPIEFPRTADLNWDEYIDLKDVTILLQVIAGWEKHEGVYEAGPY